MKLRVQPEVEAYVIRLDMFRALSRWLLSLHIDALLSEARQDVLPVVTYERD